MGKIVFRYTDAEDVEHGPAFVPLVSQTHRMTSTNARHSHDDTCLRNKMRLQVIMRIPPTGGPPLEAMLRIEVSALAAFHVSNQFFMPPPFSDDPNVLIVDRLTQRLVPDPEIAGGYVSYWDQEAASVTTTMRKGDGISSGPYVNFGLMWNDPEGATNDVNGYLFWWDARLQCKTWWGSTHL
jgi:hypothetical protein